MSWPMKFLFKLHDLVHYLSHVAIESRNFANKLIECGQIFDIDFIS